MGSLGYWFSDDPTAVWVHVCGTTLVSKIHFITAAHCVEAQEKNEKRYRNIL